MLSAPAPKPPAIKKSEDLMAHVVLGVTRESVVLEFKRDYPDRHQQDQKTRRGAQLEVCRDIAQFANTWGGCIVIGVAEASDHSGLADSFVAVTDPDGLLQWIQQAVANHLMPPPDGLDLVRVETDSGTLVCVNVPASRSLCAVWNRDEKTIQYVRRDLDKKAYMNPDEAITGVLDRSRTTRLAFHAALTAAGGTVLGPLTLVPSLHILVPRNAAQCRVYLRRVHEFGVEVEVIRDWHTNTMINIPWELVRAAWPTVEPGKVGIALHARIHVSNELAWLDE